MNCHLVPICVLRARTAQAGRQCVQVAPTAQRVKLSVPLVTMYVNSALKVSTRRVLAVQPVPPAPPQSAQSSKAATGHQTPPPWSRVHVTASGWAMTVKCFLAGLCWVEYL
jgi:hypothetical protein